MRKNGRSIIAGAALALAILCTPAGDGAFVSPVMAQQADALAAYNNALNHFKAVLAERRAPDRFETTAAEPARTGALPRPQHA